MMDHLLLLDCLIMDIFVQEQSRYHYSYNQDVVTRYASQTGHHVERRFGWDCHGLPVEYEIDKKLGIKTKKDIYDV